MVMWRRWMRIIKAIRDEQLRRIAIDAQQAKVDAAVAVLRRKEVELAEAWWCTCFNETDMGITYPFTGKTCNRCPDQYIGYPVCVKRVGGATWPAAMPL